MGHSEISRHVILISLYNWFGSLQIFEKALDEPKYSSMYAQLCKRLAENAPNFDPPESSVCTFKRLLLNKCRLEFENRAQIALEYENVSNTVQGQAGSDEQLDAR